jgi:hypothetical protein
VIGIRVLVRIVMIKELVAIHVVKHYAAVTRNAQVIVSLSIGHGLLSLRYGSHGRGDVAQEDAASIIELAQVSVKFGLVGVIVSIC